MRHLGTTVLAIALMGCGVTEGDDDVTGGKGDGTGTCKDAMYGDGTCQLDLACGIPDIDCFQTFTTDAEAGAWLNALWPVPQVPETDERFTRSRALLDRAWDVYKVENSLGTLADHRLALVLIEDPTANAFAIGDPDGGKAALTVHLHTGILGETDENLLGIIFHELAHITKLHVFPEIKERTRRFYVATDVEPIGAKQVEHAKAKELGTAWQKHAWFVGSYSAAAFGELPYGGNLQELFWLYLDRVRFRQPECTAQVSAVEGLYSAIESGYSAIDRSITIPANVVGTIPTALEALGACASRTPLTMQQFLSESTSSEWVSYVMTELPADEHWLLAEDAFEVITLLADDRRGKQRALETTFQREMGRPWSALRFFSTEEHADDVSVEMTQAAKLPAPGVSGFMLNVLGDERARCEQLIAANGLVPYGSLLDDHHGECWRAAHAQQLVTPAGSTARIAPVAEPARVPRAPTRMPDGKPMH